MKKIMIGILISVALVGGGIIAVNKYNESLAQQYESTEKTIEVMQGKLSVNVVGSGNIELKDSEGNNLNELKVKIEVDELDINKMKIGQNAQVKVSAFSDEVFNGKVVSIAEKGEVVNGVTTYGVEISLESLINKSGEINSDEVRLRQGPAVDYMVIRTLGNGEDFKILSKQDKWYEISLEDGTTGWVYSDYIKLGTINTQDVQATTVGDLIEVRKGASTNYGIITKLTKDNVVQIIDKDNNWYKIKLNDAQEGWVQESNLIFQKLKVGMTATVSILIDEKEDTLYLPVECVNKSDDGYVVMLKGSSEYKEVNTGIVTDDFIEIKNGISKGDEVKVLKQENSNLESVN